MYYGWSAHNSLSNEFTLSMLTKSRAWAIPREKKKIDSIFFHIKSIYYRKLIKNGSLWA